MTTTMTLTNTDWTRAQITAGWLDTETRAVAEAAADTEIAWLINRIGQHLTGWTYTDGTFSGPARAGALATVLRLITEAADYAVAKLDEIRADA